MVYKFIVAEVFKGPIQRFIHHILIFSVKCVGWYTLEDVLKGNVN